MACMAALAGCAVRPPAQNVSLLTTDRASFDAAVDRLLLSGDITQQAVVEGMVATKLSYAGSISSLFGLERRFRPAPGNTLAARAGILWEKMEFDARPRHPTRVAALSIRNLPALLCLTPAEVERRFSGEFSTKESPSGITVYSKPDQDGEFYVRFTEGADSRCFAEADFVQGSNR